MTRFEIRQVSGGEMLDALHPLTSYAFHASPPFPEREQWDARVGVRPDVTCFVAYDGKTPVACVESTAMTQNVRGAVLGMGGVWGVVTHPSARRQGLCRRLLTELLASMRATGKGLSGLYPFRESFYERLGYVTFPQLRKAVFSPLALASLMDREVGGDVRLMLLGESVPIYRALTEKLQRVTHGMALVDTLVVSPSCRDRAWVAVAVVDGEPEGALLYSLEGDEVANFTMVASRWLALSSRARYLLLQWIARHIDQATRVELTLAPTERPETWWSDMKPQLKTTHVAPMGRVVDLAELQGLRAGPGAFTVRVSDPLCPWNEGVWRFESDGDELHVVTAGDTHALDGELSIQAISALVYGVHDPADFPFRGWGTVSPALLARLRSMFSPMLPHMHEQF